MRSRIQNIQNKQNTTYNEQLNQIQWRKTQTKSNEEKPRTSNEEKHKPKQSLAILAQDAMQRTRDIALADLEVKQLLDAYVPLARCHPRQLFRVRKINRDGTTSDWEAIASCKPLLSALLEKSKGLKPLQESFVKQLDSWLRGHSLSWALVDVEGAVHHLRVQLSTLQSYARNRRAPPRRHASLSCLIDKMYVKGNDEAMVETVATNPNELEDNSEIEEIPISKAYGRGVQRNPAGWGDGPWELSQRRCGQRRARWRSALAASERVTDHIDQKQQKTKMQNREHRERFAAKVRPFAAKVRPFVGQSKNVCRLRIICGNRLRPT